MKLYVGIDLHSDNNFLTIIDESHKTLYARRLKNDRDEIIKVLEPYQPDIVGIVIESTYNWYWLNDALEQKGYPIHLANMTAAQQYRGQKRTDDKSDARWLAQMLSMNILPEGYIYPKETRGLRELLRKRMFMVRMQTKLLISIQSIMTRYEGITVPSPQLKNEKLKNLESLIKDNNVRLAGESQLKVLRTVQQSVDTLEDLIQPQIKENPRLLAIRTIPGVGPILGMTILLETGDIHRFRKAGCYASYCRTVDSERISNGKKKGENNRKNGNVYLAWAFLEAANYAIRYDERIKKYYQRKMSRTNRIVALKTIAHKLAKMSYYLMSDGGTYDVLRAF